MRGLMMDYPLTLTHVLERSAHQFAKKELITRTPNGLHHTTYGDMYGRIHRLASALKGIGVSNGDRVATLCWNHVRHMELYMAVPCMGAVLHTLNFRLGNEQLAYIINHAGDSVICADRSLLPYLLPIRDQLPLVKHLIILNDGAGPELEDGPHIYDYEALLAAAQESYAFEHLDENAAAGMCYTSGTTGNPKGVVYSHRAICLHSLAIALPDAADIRERDRVMPVVPMFHVNAWGLPFASTMVGSTQVFPGAAPQPADLARLIQEAQVTIAAGVPTVWIGLLAHMQAHPGEHDLRSVRHFMAGGSAVPRQLMEAYERDIGVRIIQAWGMTETTPVAVIARTGSWLGDLSPDDDLTYRAKTGTALPFVDIKIIDDADRALPHDGKAFGELVVRGPWVLGDYYNAPDSRSRFTDDGWFRTGDVATIDPDEYVQIVDRAKDVIKSGGEWISSVALENALMGHPHVLEAAVIAIPDPRWQERPMACVVPRAEYRAVLTADVLRAFLAEHFPRWWLPEEIVFIDEVPRTSVGKFSKRTLRDRFAQREQASPHDQHNT